MIQSINIWFHCWQCSLSLQLWCTINRKFFKGDNNPSSAIHTSWMSGHFMSIHSGRIWIRISIQLASIGTWIQYQSSMPCWFQIATNALQCRFMQMFWTKHVSCTAIYCIGNDLTGMDWNIKQHPNHATVAKSTTRCWYICILNQRFLFRRSKFALCHSIIQSKCLDDRINETNLPYFHEASCLVTTQGDAQKFCYFVLLFQIDSLLMQFHHLFVNIIFIYRPEEDIANLDNCHTFISNEEKWIHIGLYHVT